MANVATTSQPESLPAGFEGAPRTPTSISSSTGGPESHTQTASASGSDSASLLQPNAHTHKAAVLTARHTTASLSPKTEKPHPRSHMSLTGAAAIAEMKRQKQAQQQGQSLMSSRQTSPNPQVQAMQSLLGAGGMSKPTDAPAPDKMSEPVRKAAEKISVPNSNARADQEHDVSPGSLGTFVTTLEGSGIGANNAAMTATAGDNQNSQYVAEPAQIGDEQSYHHTNNGHLAVQHQNNDKDISLSYPGPPTQPAQGQEGGPSRSMTLPGSGYGQGSPKSPATGGKRHKCPYCSTDFTRHHNLKSHLLTHSQEKPYVCQTCQARFRRLHDLKRHTKLHTGERPHTCERCGRKFARGDALARHNKGPGGCAGRRSSFGGDDEYGDGNGEGMDGVEYDNDEDGTEDRDRRVSEPDRKRQQLETPQDPNRQVYRQHSSTYPPAPRQMQGSMGPPQVVHPGPSSATSPRDMSGQPSPAGSSMNSSYYGQGQVFAEPGMMTHSPKPLSPGQNQQDQHRLSVDNSAQLGRNRSTSLTTQFQQAHFGRGSGAGTGNRTPPQPNAQFGATQQAPHNILPPLGSTSQPQNRNIGLQPSIVPNNTMIGSHPPQYATVSNPGSLSSHGRSSGSSMRDIAGQEPNDIWQYVRQLEQKFSRMQDEYELRISRLQEELISLRGQVGQMSNANSYSSDMARPGPYP